MATEKIDYVSDWKARLLGRRYWQFREKSKIAAWIAMVAKQFQALEDAAQALLTIVSIDDSIGAQLDNLGRIVGQTRAGVTDVVYRLYLRARIVANRSNGTPEDLYRVFRALFGTTTSMVVTSGGIKAFTLRVRDVLTREQALIGLGFLLDAKEAGARATLEWQESIDAALFTFDSGPGFDVGLFAAALRA